MHAPPEDVTRWCLHFAEPPLTGSHFASSGGELDPLVSSHPFNAQVERAQTIRGGCCGIPVIRYLGPADRTSRRMPVRIVSFVNVTFDLNVGQPTRNGQR